MKSLPSSHWRRGFTLALVVGLAMACGDIRQDEFLCENAAGHLQQCCPGFSASAIDCTYAPGCTTTVYPELDATQSDCIMGESCGTLRATGVCDRVAALPFQQGLDAGTSPAICTGATAVAVATPDSGDDGSTGGLGIGCLSASDCPATEVCCGEFDPQRIACMPLPCASGFQPCATSLECGPGRTCQRFTDASSAGICATIDASTEADVDATTDGPDVADVETATDAAPDVADVESAADARYDAAQ
jgi:hypothetical protein